MVKDIHAHYPEQGYRNIKDTLLFQFGWFVCDYCVLKSMQRLGITGYVRKRKAPQPTGKEHTIFPNVLNRQFNSSALPSNSARPLSPTSSNIKST